MQGTVTILSYNPNADTIVSSGGRISTMDGTANEIYAKSVEAGTEKNRKLIGKVMSSGHTSVLEHATVNLSFENVSVFAEQFLIEFRLASFTVKSRRYVDFSGAGFITPEFSGEDRKRVFCSAAEAMFHAYDALIEKGVPKEDARFVLPYCFCSNFFCSMNARELMHVMNELVYGRGRRYPELVALGESLFAQCEKLLPYLAVRKQSRYETTTDFDTMDAEPLLPSAPVEILAGPDHPEDLILSSAMAARGRLMPQVSEEEKKQLLSRLLAGTRKRELEQASYTMLFRGMSLAALTHLSRHRMQSMVAPNLVKCASYDNYVLPETVVTCGAEEIYSSAFQTAKEAAEALKAMGEGESTLCYLLLAGQKVPVLTTMNAGELYTFFRLRCCTRAQWEIREYAMDALKALRRKAPLLFGLYGPTCVVDGACPEGKMTCGRAKEMKERFSGELESI